MTIDRIYVAGYRHDVRFTRACIASIRVWYPEIPISLIKDRFYGDYSTSDIEKYFRCDVLDTGERIFGWGFGKLEPLFHQIKERFLVLDSDIVLAGPVLNRFKEIDSDFIVQREDNPAPEFVLSNYYDLQKLTALIPDFAYPDHTFNTGQWIGTSGLIAREDFTPFVEFTNPPKARQPEIFKLGEQGLLNYFLIHGLQQGRWSLTQDAFMEVGSNSAVAEIDLMKLNRESPYEFVIHWCGLRHQEFSEMVRGDILEHFEKRFYTQLPCGTLRRRLGLTAARTSRVVRGKLKSLLRPARQ